MVLSYDIKTKLETKEKDKISEAYRKYHEYIYGPDYFDAFLKVTNSKSNDYKNKKELLKDLGTNYYEALNIVNDDSVLYLCIYNNSSLVAFSRIKNSFILDIVNIDISIKELRTIYKEIITFIEKYLINKKYNKVYLKIPRIDGPLLIRSQELGYKEDSSLINNKEYIVSKELER